MKRTILFITLTLLMVNPSFCNEPMRELREVAEELNSACPMDFGMAGLVSGVHIEQDAMVMEVAIGENNPLNFSVLEKNMSLYKKGVLTGFAKPTTMPLMTTLANANARLVMKIVRKSTGETFRVVFSQTEIKDVAEGRIKEATGRESLEIMALNGNLQCPLTVDAISELQSMSFDGNYFVYNYIVDDSQVDIQALRDNPSSMRDFLLNGLRANDIGLQLLKDACHEAGMGISYRYVGKNSGQTFTVNIEHYEF